MCESSITCQSICYYLQVQFNESGSNHVAMPEANAFPIDLLLSRQTRRCQTSSAAALPEGISPSLINDEFLKDRLQSVSRRKIAHSSHDGCYPTHTLYLTLGKMDSLPCCYFFSIFFLTTGFTVSSNNYHIYPPIGYIFRGQI